MAATTDNDEESFRQQEEKLNETLDSDDYYAFLNISREATLEEINHSFRRYSRIFHPDKHTDPINKKYAEDMFANIKKAHEVLSDPHKRAIYDTLGSKGLETDGWEVVQRTKTPGEIREEYERLAKEREERLLQQRTNPKGTVSVSIDATDVFERYTPNPQSEEYSGLPNVEISQMNISQSVDCPLTLKDTCSLSGSLQTQNGRGSGAVTATFRRVVSAISWAEMDVTAGNGLQLAGRIYRSFLPYKSFGMLTGTASFTQNGLSPGLQAMVAKHFDKHTVGHLTWRAGQQSSMTTQIMWTTDNNYVYLGVQFGIPHTYLHMTYVRKFLEREAKIKLSTKIGTFGAIFEYGYEQKVSKQSIVGASMSIGVPVGVTFKLRIGRGNQQYVFPVLLAEEIAPAAIFYGTVIPLVTYYAVNVMIIRPYMKRQNERDTEEMREKNLEKLTEKRKEAENAVSLMQETVARNREQEESRLGLVIEMAYYGRLVTDNDSDRPAAVIDVTVPLQCLVQNSKLILQESSKSSLPGFYDPCPGDEKSLFIEYRFHNHRHRITIKDEDVLAMPKTSHKIS